MSVSGISSSSLYSSSSIQNGGQNNAQQIQQEFLQLGTDLRAGNLSAARSDFSTLQGLAAPATSTSSAQSTNPIAQAFAQLAKDLQSGNLSAAQQDFSTIQQDFQQSAASQSQTGQTAGHRHHRGGGGGGSEISQLLSELGTALQSGNLSEAQQAYTSLAQQFQSSSSSASSAASSTAETGAASTTASGVSLIA
jgi:hypothetical protein